MTEEKLKRTLNIERKTLLNEAESLAQMGSWKWIENRNELVWSEGLYKIFSKNPEEGISWQTFLDNVFPEDTQLVLNFLHEVKTYRRGSSIDYRIIKKGEVRHLALTVKPQSALNIDILGAVIDITDRKEYARQLEQNNLDLESAIKELDEKEKKYRILFERSIDPIFLATDELVLMDVNRSFLKYFEYSNTETESITMRSIFADVEDFYYFRNTVTIAQQIKDFEVLLITKTGERKVCLLNCVFIPDQAAGLCCYQGIIHDLTQRKQTENDLLNAERLSLTGKIARTIAHEVRNPLTNLILAMDQLRGEILPDSESVIFYLDVIERNANRIEKLMDEMLNSSKPKLLDLTLTCVSEMINNTISQAMDRIKLREIQLHFSCEENLPRILIDNKQIQIALLNIIINAVESMLPKKGILKINASRKDKILLVTISDNGKGIPADAIGKLFNPFFTDKPGGKGLGLTLTKNILSSHNIEIEVVSDMYNGTTFFVYFKLAE